MAAAAAGSVPGVYRFLLSPRWLALALVMALAAVTMVFLGLWQLSRYHYRSDVNARIDAAAQAPPRSMADVFAPPPAGGVGAAPEREDTWSVVAVTGHYDQAHEILARARSRDGSVGFEVITPLVLDDGTAVLVDRGWLPAPAGGAGVAPDTPVAPSGEVVVVGRVHAPESRAGTPEPFDGGLAVRRIDPAKIKEAVPYPLYGGYLTLERQTPPADPAFVPIPPDHENAVLNAAYTVQWWAFAVLTLVGYGYLAYRHAHPVANTSEYPPTDEPAPTTH
jgi:cytochrome oxidase assembly protein ShyY1